MIIGISQDTLERLVENCMESHNQGPRIDTRATSSSKTTKDFSVRQLMYYQSKHQVQHQP